MARLGQPIWPDVEYEHTDYGDFPVDWQAESAWMEDFLADRYRPRGSIRGAVFRHPIGDGFAFYEVTSVRPLVLSPIMYGDRWELPAAHLRGLTEADVKANIEYQRRMTEVFGRKSPGKDLPS